MARQVIDKSKVSSRVQKFSNTKVVAIGHSLTYKSSVNDACVACGFELYEFLVQPQQRAWRYIFATQEFCGWLKSDLPKLTPRRKWSDQSLKLQIATEFDAYCYGHTLNYGDDIRRLDPIKECVWELKTDELRIFGWFPHKNYFVAHLGELKERLTKFDNYKPFIANVCEFRSRCTNKLGHHVDGGYTDVVSDRPRPV